MKQITLKDYNALHPDYRGIWDIERTDWPEWSEVRSKYWGKRTMLSYEDGATVLLVEGLHFEITGAEPLPEPQDDNLKITFDSGDTIDIYIDPVKMPDIYRRKVKCLLTSGMSKEAAEKHLLQNPLQLELFYDIGQGLFAVEAEAIDSTPIFNPYTGKKIPVIED